MDCLIQTFKFPDQFGTHIDFPGHFVKDAPLSEQYGVKDMVFPLCVIDITAKVARLVDEKGSAVILKNNVPRYLAIEFSQAEKLQEAEDEDVLRISERLLLQNREAYEVLAQ